MKKRKTALLAFLLLATVGLGVGYAALSDELSITGTANASAKDANFDIDLALNSGSSHSGKATVTVAADDADTATITLDGSKFQTKGDAVTVTFDVTNNSLSDDLTAYLSANVYKGDTGTTAWTSEYFTIDATLGSTSIAVEGTTTLTVTVTLIKTPTAAVAAETFRVVVTGSSEQ